jgi:threonine dehydratase
MRHPDFADVEEAARRLEGQAHRTPVMTSRTLDRRVGARVFFKCENLQRVGAFKFRGAYNAIARLGPEERRRGVVTFSSGNHAQAMALVGGLLGVAVTVVMPADAPATKRRATEGYGATVIDYDPARLSREEIARGLQAERGLTLVPPYDHPDVIAGQGTAALEMLAQCGPLDYLLAPCGGGGLLGGTALAAAGRAPDCRVVGIEPALADDAARSFRSGQLHTVHNPPTIADGTRTPCLGQITFPLIRRLVHDMQTVSEEAIMAAVAFLFYRLKLVVEPSGALGLAALMAGAAGVTGRVGVILSGGNIDGPTMIRVLEADAASIELRS